MLTDSEVIGYYESVCSKFLNDPDELFVDTRENSGGFSFLLCNGKVAAIATFPESARVISDFENLVAYSFVKRGKNPNLIIDKKKSWTVCLGDNEWIRELRIHNIEELKKLILVNQKVTLLDYIHRRIGGYRRIISCKTRLQHMVYLDKYVEAKDIIIKNVEKDETGEYPLVSGYADIDDITLQEAASRIIFQYESQKACLAESENIRIRFTRKVQKAIDLDELNQIKQDFDVQYNKYGVL